MKKNIIAALFGLSLIGTSHAEFITEERLLKFAKSENTEERTFFMGYIAGVFDCDFGTIHCAPQNVTLGKVRDMVIEVLNEVPVQPNRSADVFIATILKLRWPCKSNNSDPAPSNKSRKETKV